MKWFLGTLISVICFGCASTIPSGSLTPYRSQLNHSTISYALPSGARFLAGPPAPDIKFPSHRPYPLSGGVAAVGWEFYRDIPQVMIDLGLEKISTARFGSQTAPAEWEAILQSERVSIRAGNRIRIIQDAAGRDWQETVVETRGRIEARSFLRPIAPDTLILLRLSFSDHVEEIERARALTIQDRMLNSIIITPTDTAEVSNHLMGKS